MSDITDTLRQELEAIRDETRMHANTATRIGNALLGLLGLHDVAANQWLSKTDDDIARGIIMFLKDVVAPGIGSVDFTQNMQGWKIYRTEGGYTVGEFDDIVARRKASFNTVELRETAYLAGNYVFGPAGSVISKVVPVDEQGNELDIDLTLLPAQWPVQPFAFRCFMIMDDGTTATINAWRAGDQAMRETFNIKSGVYQGVENQYYWRCVERVGGDWVDLSWMNAVEGCNDTLAGVPKVGDKICCEGHQTIYDMVVDSEGNPVLDEDNNPIFDTDDGRFGFIEIVTSGQKLVSFTVYDGVTDFSKTRRNWVFRIEGNLIYQNAKNIVTLHDGVEIETPQYAGDWQENYNDGQGYSRPLWVTFDGCGFTVILPKGNYTTEAPIVYDEITQSYRQSSQWHLLYGTSSLLQPKQYDVRLYCDTGTAFNNGLDLDGDSIKVITLTILQEGTDVTTQVAEDDINWWVKKPGDTLYAHVQHGGTIFAYNFVIHEGRPLRATFGDYHFEEWIDQDTVNI